MGHWDDIIKVWINYHLSFSMKELCDSYNITLILKQDSISICTHTIITIESEDIPLPLDPTGNRGVSVVILTE